MKPDSSVLITDTSFVATHIHVKIQDAKHRPKCQLKTIDHDLAKNGLKNPRIGMRQSLGTLGEHANIISLVQFTCLIVYELLFGDL